MKTILLLQRPVEVLKVFADLKFSLIGFLFFKIQTSKKLKRGSHKTSHIGMLFLCEVAFLNLYKKFVFKAETHSLLWCNG